MQSKGVNVELIIQDDIPTLATIFSSDTAHCAWRTSDFWAQEHPNLRNAGMDARAVMVVDNTQGADAIIARINKIASGCPDSCWVISFGGGGGGGGPGGDWGCIGWALSF